MQQFLFKKEIRNLCVFLTPFTIAFIVIAIFNIYNDNPDCDCFYMARTGQWIIDNHAIPRMNYFVAHEGYALTVQQWLFCIICDVILYNFGVAGAYVWSYTVYVLMFVMFYIYVHKYIDGKSFSFFVTAFIMVLMSSYCKLRPYTLDMFMIMGVVMCCDMFVKTHNKKFLIPLPFISFLSINLHASFWLFMFVFMMPFVVPHKLGLKALGVKNYIKDWFSEAKWFLLTMCCMIATSFLNPLGLQAMLFFKQFHVTDLAVRVGEMKPMTYTHEGVMYVVALLIFALAIVLKLKQGKLKDFSVLYLIIGPVILALFANRNAILLSIPFLYSLQYVFPKDFAVKHELVNIEIGINVVILTVVSIALVIMMTNPFIGRFHDGLQFNISAIDYLDEHNVDKETTKIYHWSDAGSYIEFRGYKGWLDSRAEMFYKDTNGVENTYDEFDVTVYVDSNEADVKAYFDKYDFDYVITPYFEDSTTVRLFLNSDTYREVVTIPDSDILLTLRIHGYRMFEKIK